MNELEALYQEVILDHSRKPHNVGVCVAANRKARGHNPLCGDQLSLTLRVEDDTIREAKFDGLGCAISTASASMMTDAILGKTTTEAIALAEKFRSSILESDESAEELGSLVALRGVREFPTRVKCATLAWHTLMAALKECTQSVSTEVPETP